MTDHEIALAMATYGGGFARKFAAAFLAADDVNRYRLREAFPELFMEYGRLAQLKAEQTAAGR